MAEYYYIRAGDDGIDDAERIECDYSEASWRYVLRCVAKDFHDEHDGWEATWPIDFEVFNAQKVSMGVFTVEREYEPYFSPNRKPTNPTEAKP